MNASLATIRAGLKPLGKLTAPGNHREAPTRDYILFLVKRVKFTNGKFAGQIFNRIQVRRLPGEGHKREERAARREKRNADYRLRREYKRARRADRTSQNIQAPTAQYPTEIAA
jgi:hypothetical protein